MISAGPKDIKLLLPPLTHSKIWCKANSLRLDHQQRRTFMFLVEFSCASPSISPQELARHIDKCYFSFVDSIIAGVESRKCKTHQYTSFPLCCLATEWVVQIVQTKVEMHKHTNRVNQSTNAHICANRAKQMCDITLIASRASQLCLLWCINRLWHREPTRI